MTAFRQIAARLAAGAEPLAEPQDPMLGGLPVGAWFALFRDTHEPDGFGGMRRAEWPDGGAYADQPAVLVEALAAVREAVVTEWANERRRSGG